MLELLCYWSVLISIGITCQAYWMQPWILCSGCHLIPDLKGVVSDEVMMAFWHPCCVGKQRLLNLGVESGMHAWLDAQIQEALLAHTARMPKSHHYLITDHSLQVRYEMTTTAKNSWLHSVRLARNTYADQHAPVAQQLQHERNDLQRWLTQQSHPP